MYDSIFCYALILKMNGHNFHISYHSCHKYWRCWVQLSYFLCFLWHLLPVYFPSASIIHFVICVESFHDNKLAVIILTNLLSINFFNIFLCSGERDWNWAVKMRLKKLHWTGFAVFVWHWVLQFMMFCTTWAPYTARI